MDYHTRVAWKNKTQKSLPDSCRSTSFYIPTSLEKSASGLFPVIVAWNTGLFCFAFSHENSPGKQLKLRIYFAIPHFLM
jgi:hypothetical protein